MRKSSHFVLVHGASHGAWCWYKIRTVLECIGHKVSCPDLRGSGADAGDPNHIMSFQEYNQPLDDILAALPTGEKIILVGHSAGGLSVMEAIRKYPATIQVAVFVAGIMLKNGFQNHQDMAFVTVKEPNLFEFGYHHGHDHPPTSAILKKEFQRQILFNNSPLEDCTLAAMMLRPFPTIALRDKKISEGNDVEKVARVYIKTMHDNIYSKEMQEYLIQQWPPAEVYEIATDHSPMFSAHLDLLALLLKVATNLGLSD
ncbi:methylesterase 17-like [Amaranthus tricolor]|uniref:methylesterase 17-like n=1 Tax=Amaranthus tricolor TaxID=29722 RepID=UPI0025827D5C|nr:methylesterase 17-like [Amaranthus tricolor]